MRSGLSYFWRCARRILPRLLVAAVGVWLAAPGAVDTAAAAKPGKGVPPPRLEARAWNDSLLPPSFSPADEPMALRGFPPDSLDDAKRPKLQATWAGTAPALDGRVGDWPVVRWHELRGGTTLLRGQWNGGSDAALDFALLWTAQGLVLGATLRDDTLVVGRENAPRVESVLLYLSSSSTLVQRYWAGSERAVRLCADGQLEAWTRWHNRRVALFDPQVLGTRGAARVQRDAGSGGKVAFELFVPWDLLFPALPHDEAALLVNVLVEDVDGGSEKLFAWVTRPGMVTVSKPGKVDTRKPGLVSAWARLQTGGGPAAGTWISSIGTRHWESGFPFEWSVWRFGATGETKPVVLAAGLHGERPLRVEVSSQPALVRYHGAPSVPAAWPRSRRLELDLGTPGAAPWRHDLVHLAPTRASLAAGLAEVSEPTKTAAKEPSRFPRPADIAVRLRKAEEMLARLGDWREVRAGERGILAARAAAWAGIENRLLESQVLRDLLLPAPDKAGQEQLLAALWPRRSSQGFPISVPFLRGQWSAPDGSLQPHAVYLSQAAAAGTPAPLLLVLHDLGENEMAPLEIPALLAAVEARGWIAVSPYARGDTGFELAGERDVLDVLQQCRSELPVDPTRLYVTGFGMGATGAWLLSLRHANLFAAAAIVSGYGDMDQPGIFQALAYQPEEIFFYETMNPARLVRPEVKTAFRVVHAEQDQRISVVHARVLAERLQEYGIAHEVVLPPTTLEGRALFESELGANLDFLAAHRRVTPGEVDATWQSGTGGPVASVFARGPFVVVRGTRSLPGAPVLAGPDSTHRREVTGPAADARTAQHFTEEWQSLFAGVPRVLDDTKVDAKLQATTNLVLVGDPRTNRVLAEVASKLPVHYQGDRFEVDGKSWSFNEAGIVFATAHPAVSGRTVVVLSGMPERLGGAGKSLLKLGADYVVVTDDHEILAIGHFRGFGGKSRPPTGDSR